MNRLGFAETSRRRGGDNDRFAGFQNGLVTGLQHVDPAIETTHLGAAHFAIIAAIEALRRA